jgi:hypothetical protein
MPIAPRSKNRLAATGMKAIADRNLTTLIVGIMSLLRQGSVAKFDSRRILQQKLLAKSIF